MKNREMIVNLITYGIKKDSIKAISIIFVLGILITMNNLSSDMLKNIDLTQKLFLVFGGYNINYDSLGSYIELIKWYLPHLVIIYLVIKNIDCNLEEGGIRFILIRLGNKKMLSIGLNIYSVIIIIKYYIILFFTVIITISVAFRKKSVNLEEINIMGSNYVGGENAKALLLMLGIFVISSSILIVLINTISLICKDGEVIKIGLIIINFIMLLISQNWRLLNYLSLFSNMMLQRHSDFIGGIKGFTLEKSFMVLIIIFILTLAFSKILIKKVDIYDN